MNETQTRPRGLNGLFHSKRFWSSIIGIVVMIISAHVPSLEDNLQHIAPTIAAIVMTIIGGYSVQDAAREINTNQGGDNADK